MYMSRDTGAMPRVCTGLSIVPCLPRNPGTWLKKGSRAQDEIRMRHTRSDGPQIIPGTWLKKGSRVPARDVATSSDGSGLPALSFYLAAVAPAPLQPLGLKKGM